MKISSVSTNNPTIGGVAASRSDSVAGSGALPGNAAASSKGSVDLSAAARHLSNLQNGDNDINVERIDEIRAAIQAGQLKIDPSRIADGLIASVRDLLK